MEIHDHKSSMESLGRNGVHDRSGAAGAPIEPFVVDDVVASRSCDLPDSKPECSPELFSGLEKFVDADVVANFLAVRRAEVLKLTRDGVIGGNGHREQQRHTAPLNQFSKGLTGDIGVLPPSSPINCSREPLGQRRAGFSLARRRYQKGTLIRRGKRVSGTSNGPLP